MPSRLALFVLTLALAACQPEIEQTVAETAPPAEIPAAAPAAGLINDAGWELVQANCSGCHSLSLVTQNHMTRSNWIHTIRWMQKKQGLWELGDSEAVIVDYLEKNYGVSDVPWRRKPLDLGSE
jgi:cytochrome c5